MSKISVYIHCPFSPPKEATSTSSMICPNTSYSATLLSRASLVSIYVHL